MFTSLTMLGRRCRLNLCVGHLRSGLAEQDAALVSEMLSLSTNFRN